MIKCAALLAKAIDALGSLRFSDPYSGQLRVRLPLFIHARLAERADFEGVSLNSLINVFIAEGLAGRRHVDDVDENSSLSTGSEAGTGKKRATEPTAR